MNHFGLDDSSEMPLGGRKDKTCSMSNCPNTHQRFPNMSFFRFPKELSRAKEWLVICERPDLMRRVDIGDITINNYYVCEAHFPNQILDYATRKILIKTAKPLSVAELKALPGRKNDKLRRQSDDYEQDYDDDDFEIEDAKELKFGHSFGVKIAKAEGNYHSDLLEPLTIHDEDSYMDTLTRAPYCWTLEATRLLIKLRGERDGDFEQSGARKSQLWLEICNKMRESGYDFTPEKVSKKWHNITITYQKNTEKKSGSVSWEFFEDMHAIFRNKEIQDDSNEYEPEPKQNGGTKRKANDISIDDRDTPDSDESFRPPIRESVRLKKMKADVEDQASDFTTPHTSAPTNLINDENWWKTYFERKLELEREKIKKEDERHKDRMNFQKMAIMLQERVEKIKIEAMNNLTNALQRLQESGKL